MSDSFTGNHYFDTFDLEEHLECYQDCPNELENIKYLHDVASVSLDIIPLEVRIYLDWLQKIWETVGSLPIPDGEEDPLECFYLQLEIKGRQAIILGNFIFYEDEGKSYQEFIEEAREFDIDEIWEDPSCFIDLELLNQQLEKYELPLVRDMSWDQDWDDGIPNDMSSDDCLWLIESMITYQQDPTGLEVVWRQSTSKLDMLDRAATLYQRVLDEVFNIIQAHFIQELFIELAENSY